MRKAHENISTTSVSIVMVWLFSIMACGLDVEDATPPIPPIWVEKSAPLTWPERGIDAHENGGIYLEWFANPDADIEGYSLLRAKYFEGPDSLGAFSRIKWIENRGSTDMHHYRDFTAKSGITYYYILKVTDNSGNFEQADDTLHYTCLDPIATETMVPSALSDTMGGTRELRWGYNNHIEMEDYVITVTDANGSLQYRTVIQPSGYVGAVETHTIPDSIHLSDGQHYQWRVDVQADYFNLRETRGGESRWVPFVFYADGNN